LKMWKQLLVSITVVANADDDVTTVLRRYVTGSFCWHGTPRTV